MMATIDQCARQAMRFEFPEMLAASITFDEDGRPSTQPQVSACLLNLSSHGAKLAVPSSLSPSKTFRLKLTVQQFSFEFYVAAKVCWTADDGGKSSIIGCQFNPGLPEGLLAHLVAGGELDRRASDREKAKSAIKIVREGQSAVEQETVALQNSSAGGFCIEARRAIAPGEKFLVISERLEADIVAIAHWQLKQSGVYLLGCGYVGEMGFERLERALSRD